MEQANSNEKNGSNWDCFSCAGVGVVLGLLILWILPSLSFINNPRSRYKSNFTASMQQLKNIANGLEQEILEKGSLKGVKSEDDICHHILSGYDEPKGCKGQVKARVNEICLKDTLRVEIIDGRHYEIRAQSNEKSQCKICVTESAVRPKIYDPAGACQKYDCVHNGE